MVSTARDTFPAGNFTADILLGRHFRSRSEASDYATGCGVAAFPVRLLSPGRGWYVVALAWQSEDGQAEWIKYVA